MLIKITASCIIDTEDQNMPNGDDAAIGGLMENNGEAAFDILNEAAAHNIHAFTCDAREIQPNEK